MSSDDKPLPRGWANLFRSERQPGELGGMDALRVWWLLQELEIAGVVLSREGDAIRARKKYPGSRGLDDRLRQAIRNTRPALLLWIDAQATEQTQPPETRQT
jgi:hypothetical protein